MGDPILDRIREIVADFPEVEERLSWGWPHFRVRGKIFAWYYEWDGVPEINFRTDLDEQAELVSHPPRYRMPKYKRGMGYVSIRLDGRVPWKMVASHLETGWRTVAPKRVLKEFDRAPHPTNRP